MAYWELIHISDLEDAETADLERYEALEKESAPYITNIDGGKGSGTPANVSQTMDVVPLVTALTEFIAADKDWIGDLWDWILGILGIEPETPALPAIVDLVPEIANMVSLGSGQVALAKFAQIALVGFGKMAIELGQEQFKEWIRRKLDGVDFSSEKNLELIRERLEEMEHLGTKLSELSETSWGKSIHGLLELFENEEWVCEVDGHIIAWRQRTVDEVE